MPPRAGAPPRQGALSSRLAWRLARLVRRREETATAHTLVFEVAGWPGHLPGQHVDLRLTAPDGYTTQRSYSLAAPPDGDLIDLTVQRVDGGEVSPYLVDDLPPGAAVEIRGPVGGWFVWRVDDTAPVLLVAGGSGIVPLMAMIRARRAARSRVPFRLVHSVRTPDDRFYAPELRNPPRGDAGLDVRYVYTRAVPPQWPEPPHRVGAAELGAGGWPPDFAPDCFVCGPTGFVERVAGILVALGHDPGRVRTERFGPGG